MSRLGTTRIAAAGVVLSLLLSLLVASTSSTAAATTAAPSAAVPAGFCAALEKTADAGQTLLARPSHVAAQRVTAAALVATDILGHNPPAIATTEAHYEEMWAQDVSALWRADAAHPSSSPAEVALQVKATVALEKVDADVAKTCPGDEKAFALLVDLEKETATSGG